MISRIDYHDRRFQPVDHDPQHGATTVGHYHQEGNLLWAEFSGGSVLVGRLVGQVRPDDTIDASYCFVTASGQTIAGACVSTPTVLDDGRVRLTEDWRRLDGSSGISIIEEVAQ